MNLTEKEIILKYLKKLTFNNKCSLKLEDDVYYDKIKKILFSIDTYEEGVHFLKSSNPKSFIKKIFRSSISDIICKGGTPLTYFLSLSCKSIDSKWMRELTAELFSDSKKYGLYLGGGDTIRSKKLSITIGVIGQSIKKPILRKNAKKNEDIYITGNLGESYLGLLIKKNKINLKSKNNYFIKKFENPNLPFKFSSHLYKFASSSIDISDGLIVDLKNLCNSSKCGAILDYTNLPFSNNIRKIFTNNKAKPIDIFSRGDDYQILFTANPKKRNLIKLLANKTSTKVTRVGKIVPGKIVKLFNGDKITNLSRKKIGYLHKF